MFLDQNKNILYCVLTDNIVHLDNIFLHNFFGLYIYFSFSHYFYSGIKTDLGWGIGPMSFSLSPLSYLHLLFYY